MQKRKVVKYIVLSVVFCLCAVVVFGQIKAHCSEQLLQEKTSEQEILLKFDAVSDSTVLPVLLYNYASQVIEHEGYTISYNKDYKVANWVCYELLREELEGKAKRSDRFVPDPQVPKAESATLSDYRKSGFDRGHIAPAADFNWNATAKDETFYLSNMCPQAPSFNRGIWKNLEAAVRGWAVRDSAIWVVSGPVLPQSDTVEYATIGAGCVIVPTLFYKIILAAIDEEPRAIAFVMPNEKSTAPLWDFAVTVDSVERLTQMDFFSLLPDSIENRVEERFCIEYWFEK